MRNRRYRTRTCGIYTARPRLRLDSRHGKIAGVCAGLARYLNLQPFMVRLVFAVSLLVAPPLTLFTYGLAYLVMDADDE